MIMIINIPDSNYHYYFLPLIMIIMFSKLNTYSFYRGGK